MQLGYFLSSEEHPPADLVRNARLAEEAGFSFAMISDHYHPWTDEQGQSPFVWSVLGGIAATTARIGLVTGVTCPTVRIHPAILAQAAATTAAMAPGRFSFAVGSGENLNEHVLGDVWPSADERLEMLEEAIGVIRQLWDGELTSYRGIHYRVENARIYTLPEQPPPIIVAATGSQAASLAASVGDGLCATSPDKGVVSAYLEAGGDGPRYGKVTICWAEDEAEARRTAFRVWPQTVIPGQASQELSLPKHFEDVAKLATEEKVADSIVCGPDVDRHVEAIRAFAEAGFGHVAVHQVGPDQEGMIRFYREQVLPIAAELREAA
jgi:coenzyme F420-dependent glucose-6-phosphate dehydrogenase